MTEQIDWKSLDVLVVSDQRDTNLLDFFSRFVNAQSSIHDTAWTSYSTCDLAIILGYGSAHNIGRAVQRAVQEDIPYLQILPVLRGARLDASPLFGGAQPVLVHSPCTSEVTASRTWDLLCELTTPDRLKEYRAAKRIISPVLGHSNQYHESKVRDYQNDLSRLNEEQRFLQEEIRRHSHQLEIMKGGEPRYRAALKNLNRLHYSEKVELQ